MGFALVFIPTGQIFKVDSEDSFTKADTKELFKREVEFLVENYLRMPYENEESEELLVTYIRQRLDIEFSLKYSEVEFASKASDRGTAQKNHWVFPFIEFIKEEADARWVGDSPDCVADMGWPNLSLAEFEVLWYD